jgi:uncharacterized protein YjbI with pentapeptide repeats
MPRWPTATQSPGVEQEIARSGAPYSVKVQGEGTSLACASGAARARRRSARKAAGAALRSVRGRCTAGRLRAIDACHPRRTWPALALLAALALSALAAATPAAARPSAAAPPSRFAKAPREEAAPAPDASAPFVAVHATLEHRDGRAFVVGSVDWDGAAATRVPDLMTVGDLRLLAVSEHGHHPTVLGEDTYRRIDEQPTQDDVRIPVDPADEEAIAAGNRVVLTASQHGATGGVRTSRTYVTVAQLQPFGDKQDRIGRRDCAGEAIVPGAKLSECDLVGADLDRALVSVRDPAGTRMLLADLTGATMRGADLTGLSVAGGRLNGADARDAILDNLSLAGAEATGLDARGASSDKAGGSAGANIFDAKLTDANFAGAVLKGVSFNHSRLDGADFGGATWVAVEANTASMRGADLSGLQGFGSTVAQVDFADADLSGAPFTAADLEWAYLCHTRMPDRKSTEDRDCRRDSDPGPKPVPGRKVAVDGKLEWRDGEAKIVATVKWNAAGIANGMTAGDIRAVEVDTRTGAAAVVGLMGYPQGLPATSRFEEELSWDSPRGPDDRLVLTATQHPPLPRGGQTNGSYVTVDTLHPGRGQGRVGSRDCSDLLLSAPAPAAGGYNFCDLTGAYLKRAKLSGPIRDADLDGADLTSAELKGSVFDGSTLAKADLAGAGLDAVSMIGVEAPGLKLPKTALRSSQWRAADLDEANFSGATISDTTFAASTFRRARFDEATLGKVDLAYADLDEARFEGVEAAGSEGGHPRRSSLFLSDLSGADLSGSHWNDDESGVRPWTWATLCDTKLPADATVSGDRDCPRDP